MASDEMRVLQSPPPLMLPPRKCAEALGLPEYTIRRWLKDGFVKSVPCGRKQLINVEALRRRLEEF
jgi:predicted site-specific integrase-resolvase